MNVHTDVELTLGHEQPSLAPLFAALAEAQGEFESIVKGHQGHGFKYANISDGLDMVLPILSGVGICVMQPFTDEEMVTILAHKSGAHMTFRAKMIRDPQGRMNAIQKEGAAITYYRRYHLFSILGLATEDVVDANLWETRAVSKDFKDPDDTSLTSMPRGASVEKGATNAEKAAEAARVIIEAIQGAKTEKGLEGVVSRNQQYISRFQASYDGEYQNVLDAYQSKLSALKEESDAD